MMPSLQEILNKSEHAVITMMGLPGTGKSYLGAKIDFPQADKIIYFDMEHAFEKHVPGPKAILRLSRVPSAAEIYSFLANSKQKKVIIDASDFLDPDELVQVADAVCDALLTGKFGKVALIWDEIGEALPQWGQKQSKKLEIVFRRGRNRNILWRVGITQRPAKYAKNALALSAWYVIFALKHPLDLKQVEDVLETELNREKIKQLPVGAYLLTDGVEEHWVMA